MADPALSLVVSVTIESDRPRGAVPARTSLSNLAGVARLQRLCDQFGVRPTWLLTWPAVQDALPTIEGALAQGRCEVGSCLQPWVTPPFDANEDRLRAVYPNAVAASAVEAKLARLTADITARFGRPRSHRAAGHGLNGALLQSLERLGYPVDSSVTPWVDGRAAGGLDWREAPEVPYFPDRQRPARRGSSPVLQVPLSVSWDRAVPDLVGRALVRSGLFGQHRAIPGARLVSLDPVRSDGPTLEALAALLAERGLPCLNLSLHSHELVAGQSAACPTPEDVDRVFANLERFFRVAVDHLRAVPRTLAEFGEHWLGAAPSGRGAADAP